MPIVCLFLLLPSISTSLFGEEGELLTFKPYPGFLEYRLRVNTRSTLETNSRSFGTEGGVSAEHEDIFQLSQSIKETDDGLLDIALTFDEINLIEHGPSIGAQYKREQIVGNTQHIVTTLLGEVKEATGLPHFASRNYYFSDDYSGHDGVPLDMYRVMLAVYPQFPLRLLKTGDTWNVRDKITVTAADVPPVGGVATILYDLNVDINRRIKYTLLGFSEKKGYRTAQVAFEAKYGFEGSMTSSYYGYYSEGSGEDVGEFYFAPEKGIVVEASIKSNPVENKSVDGQTVRMWLDAKTMIFIDLDDRRTVPLKWRSDKSISFELSEPR